MELYETKFGIHNHLGDNNPLSGVLFNEAENYIKDGLYEAYMRTYLYKDIGKKLGISFDEFISRPRHQIESIVRVIDEFSKTKEKDTAELFKQMTNTTGEKK